MSNEERGGEKEGNSSMMTGGREEGDRAVVQQLLQDAARSLRPKLALD